MLSWRACSSRPLRMANQVTIKRGFFNIFKRTKVKQSSSKSIVIGEESEGVEIKIEDIPRSISKFVNRDGDSQIKTKRINWNYILHNRFGNAFLTLSGVCVGFGLLYRRYFHVNDAEAARLWYHHPHISSFIHTLHILPSSFSEKYLHYDYQLYIARLAVAILNDPDQRITSISSLLKLLQDWIDLSSLSLDEEMEFSHSSVLSVLSSIHSLDHYYVIYILGERLYKVSPITTTIQSEINSFYNYAKEDEESKRGVHKLYVISIIRNIQRHCGYSIYYPVNQRRSLFQLHERHDNQQLLIDYLEEQDDDYISLIQLTNFLACTNRQILSNTLIIYRLRLAAKKVEDDRKYQEELKKQDENRLKEFIKPLLVKEQPKTIEEVLEEEIVKKTTLADTEDKKKEDELEWWYTV